MPPRTEKAEEQKNVDTVVKGKMQTWDASVTRRPWGNSHDC